MNNETALAEIIATLDSHVEWLIVHDSGKSFALQRKEIEVTSERGRIILGFLDENGFQIWRVAGYKIEKSVLTLKVTRRFGRETDCLKFVSRVAAAELSESVELARLEKANRLAHLIIAENPKSKTIRVALNVENGRFAEIIFEQPTKKRIAVLANAAGNATPENLLTTAVFWLAKLESRKKNPITEIWIAAESKLYKTTRKLHALLKKDWKSKIRVKEITNGNSKQPTAQINEKRTLEVADLWREKPPQIVVADDSVMSRTAAEISGLTRAEIDVVFTRHGETVRFFGLPFARIRRIGDAEKCWFGIERERRILNEGTRAEFFDLLENLKNYRRFDSPNKRHELYRLAPEAWLEAILRRNIKLLDGNLVLSPIHNQFRTGADKIDLLALRSDGRLIVIELKTQPDAQMVYQAADYWRKIELQRRSGNLKKARIFGDLEIADAPTILYLAAPTLSFHHHFNFIARTVTPEMEIYRFDLNENWRENIKIMKVSKVEK